MKGLDLWTQFSQEFLRELHGRPTEQIAKGWRPETARTLLLTARDGILPSVARRMGLESPAKHYLNLDLHFKDLKGYPQIFFEVENRPDSAEDEMEKLCYVRSPLRVLITVSRWPNEDLKKLWLSVISECAQWLPESPEVVYGFAVGERKAAPTRKKALYYHLFAVTTTGQPLGEEKEEFILEF